jgi:hypothetical protein
MMFHILLWLHCYLVGFIAYGFNEGIKHGPSNFQPVFSDSLRIIDKVKPILSLFGPISLEYM